MESEVWCQLQQTIAMHRATVLVANRIDLGKENDRIEKSEGAQHFENALLRDKQCKLNYANTASIKY
jgi:hypothetical protein